MTLAIKDRNALISHRLKRAFETIEDVQFLLDHNKLLLAVNRIYYGMFYSVSALALKHHYSTSKHSQLIGWFNKNFVAQKIVDKKYGKTLHLAFDKRSTGDYDDWVEFSKEEVEELFKGMKSFIRMIDNLIHECLN
jgi:hypothetical protein